MGSNEDTLFTFMVGIPTTNRSTNRSLFKDPKLQRRYTTTSNIDTKDYIITAVSGTKVNIVDVFNYEFPTYIISTIAAAKMVLTPVVPHPVEMRNAFKNLIGKLEARG